MINSVMSAGGVNIYRRIGIALTVMVILLFLLSLINLTFAQNWKVHFFPAAIIGYALILGAAGGLVAGIVGSLYSALLLGNPYLIAGNALFGFLTGVFYKQTHKIILSVVLAFICELPWLMVSDYYFMRLPAEFIIRLVVVLSLTNMLWASLIRFLHQPLRRLLW